MYGIREERYEMNEKPLEWMAVCGESMGHKLGRYVTLMLAVVCFLMILPFSWIGLIGAVVFAVLYAWMQRHAYVEYEYNYFSEDMEISAIYNRARRKRKMRFTLSDAEYMVKKIEPHEVTKYFCNKNDEGSLYTLVVNQDGKRTAVVMEAIPEFVKVLEMKRKVR